MAHAALAGSLSSDLLTAVSHGAAQNLLGFASERRAAQSEFHTVLLMRHWPREYHMGPLDPFWNCVPLNSRINVETEAVMLVGYARTSTTDQIAGYEDQIAHLTKLGIEKVFAEQASAVASRPQLEACLDFLREGDILIVTRLGPALPEHGALLPRSLTVLERKGAAIRVLDLGIDTSSPTGRMVAEIVVAVAAFERRLLLERQKVGIAAAKAEGKYRGRVPTARQAVRRGARPAPGRRAAGRDRRPSWRSAGRAFSDA